MIRISPIISSIIIPATCLAMATALVTTESASAASKSEALNYFPKNVDTMVVLDFARANKVGYLSRFLDRARELEHFRKSEGRLTKVGLGFGSEIKQLYIGYWAGATGSVMVGDFSKVAGKFGAKAKTGTHGGFAYWKKDDLFIAPQNGLMLMAADKKTLHAMIDRASKPGGSASSSRLLSQSSGKLLWVLAEPPAAAAQNPLGLKIDMVTVSLAPSSVRVGFRVKDKKQAKQAAMMMSLAKGQAKSMDEVKKAGLTSWVDSVTVKESGRWVKVKGAMSKAYFDALVKAMAKI